MTKTITATKLRSSLFDVIEATRVNKQITNIMLHGEVVAEIRPKETEKFDWEQYRKDLKKAVKNLRKYDWSDVEKIREESKKDRFPEW